MLNLYHYHNNHWQLAWTTHDENLALAWLKSSTTPAYFERESGTKVWKF